MLEEIKSVHSYSSSGIIYHFLQESFWWIDFLFLGYFGKGHLAAGVLSMNTLFLPLLYSFEGSELVLDFFLRCEQHSEAKKDWVIVTVVSLLMWVAVFATINIIYSLFIYDLLGIRSIIISRSILYNWLLLPCFVLLCIERTLIILVHHHKKTKVILLSSLMSVLANTLGNFLFMSLFQMSLYGCVISSIISKFIAIFILVYFSREVVDYPRIIEGINNYTHQLFCKQRNISERSIQSEIEMSTIQNAESRKIAEVDDNNGEDDYQNLPLIQRLPDVNNMPITSSNQPRKVHLLQRLRKFWSLALPPCLMVTIDYWPHFIIVFFTAGMGNIALDTNQLLIFTIQYSMMVFTFPLSKGYSDRLQHLLRQSQLTQAKLVTTLAILETILVSVVFAGVLYLLKDRVGYLFTKNSDIIHRMDRMMLYACAYLIIRHCQMVFQGLLRGMGYQLDLMIFGFVSNWLLAFPLGFYLAFYFYPEMGLEGFWVGMITGSGAYTIILLVGYLLWTDWAKEARKLKVMEMGITNASIEDSNSQEFTNQLGGKDLWQFATNPILYSRGLGSYIKFSKTTEEELLEFELIEFPEEDEILDSDNQQRQENNEEEDVEYNEEDAML